MKYEIFVVDIAVLSINLDNKVNPLKKAQIAHLKVDKTSMKIPSEYANLADVFLPKLAAKLPEHIEINDHAIE